MRCRGLVFALCTFTVNCQVIKQQGKSQKAYLPSSLIEYVFVYYRVSDLPGHEYFKKPCKSSDSELMRSHYTKCLNRRKNPVYANQILLYQVLVTSNKTVYCVVYVFITNGTYMHYIYIYIFEGNIWLVRKNVMSFESVVIQEFFLKRDIFEKKPVILLPKRKGRRKNSGSLLLNFNQACIVSNKTFTSL